MIRRFFCFLISLLLIFSVAGCALPGIDPVNTDPAPDKSESTHRTDSASDLPPSEPITDTGSAPTSSAVDGEPHDILKTPIRDLTADEQERLAGYLFEKYIPCSYGIFSDVKNLSSASVWSSIEALNRTVDGDESADSRKLENVLKKIEIYYPDTAFDPTKVRVYDASTQTFAPSPADPSEYVMLSYEVKGDSITVHYEDKPDTNDPDAQPEQYATTLKNSQTEGYFTFVSSVRSGAVG